MPRTVPESIGKGHGSTVEIPFVSGRPHCEFGGDSVLNSKKKWVSSNRARKGRNLVHPCLLNLETYPRESIRVRETLPIPVRIPSPGKRTPTPTPTPTRTSSSSGQRAVRFRISPADRSRTRNREPESPSADPPAFPEAIPMNS
jgi:hypothetical protein